MKLSTRSRYGVRLMLALGISEKKDPVFLKDIARAEEISEKYLSQLIIPLKAMGLVTAYRGAHGGYILARDPARITLREIIEPLEGEMSLVDCVSSPEVCGRASECATRDVWSHMSVLLLEFLNTFTLADLIEKYRDKREHGKCPDDYSI
ncbi:MAG TPA: Rrf2 family transcriptional regulator [Spirochaetota bacterium]|nr:Rrf2 family transcriptional regulator [Spirochaetota bacterium]HPC42398.1 Rrf2 family transcriptional regulator [Spirochaetota bacterium]HPL17820.1 Rrf2 family transcriptional regulator [Spirochaetota bacterium]HQF08013.1 Rrf2 family transcriptional regulator [Spirochaetota bacterium]HQH96573.1 Rrf2 family transcriptional regulator [Spirochaetota bacterium]